MIKENPLLFPVIDAKFSESKPGEIILKAYYTHTANPVSCNVTIYRHNKKDKTLTPINTGNYSNLVESLEEVEQSLESEKSHVYGRPARQKEVHRKLNQVLLKNPNFGFFAEKTHLDNVIASITSLSREQGQGAYDVFYVIRPSFSEGLQALDSIEIPDNTLDYVLLGMDIAKMSGRFSEVFERICKRDKLNNPNY